jgi:predicted Zn-dependent protease
MQAYGIGSAVGFALPHSRNQEYEADQLGLIYAALAGYNPREAFHCGRECRLQVEEISHRSF